MYCKLKLNIQQLCKRSNTNSSLEATFPREARKISECIIKYHNNTVEPTPRQQRLLHFQATNKNN